MVVLQRIVGVVGFALFGLAMVSVVWTLSGPNAGRASEIALNAHPSIEVLEEPFLSFEPIDAKSGLVLFPDTRVQAISYAPLARVLAERGMLVVVVQPRFRIPSLSPNAPSDVFEHFPDIDVWAVGGHGAGGRVAAKYVSEHIDVRALVLLGSITSRRTDLSESEVRAISLVGSGDEFVSVSEVEASGPRMPSYFEIVPLDGGNYTLFGDYGETGLDGEATLTPSEQRNRTADAIERLLKGL